MEAYRDFIGRIWQMGILYWVWMILYIGMVFLRMRQWMIPLTMFEFIVIPIAVECQMLFCMIIAISMIILCGIHLPAEFRREELYGLEDGYSTIILTCVPVISCQLIFGTDWQFSIGVVIESIIVASEVVAALIGIDQFIYFYRKPVEAIEKK